MSYYVDSLLYFEKVLRMLIKRTARACAISSNET